MQDRLSISDSNLFPVQAFFNAIPDFRFIPIMNGLLSGIGAIINDTRCTFPGDNDPGEELFDGIKFSLFDNVVIISEEQLHQYINAVCESYVNDYPEERTEIDNILQGAK